MKAKPYHQPRCDPVVDQIASEFAGRKDLLPMLQAVHDRQGSLTSTRTIGAIADRLGISDADVFGVASFYSLLVEQTDARPVIRLCDGPVCRLHGAERVGAMLRDPSVAANYAMGRSSCLGLCDRAPAALVDLQAWGPISASGIVEMLEGDFGAEPAYSEPRPGEVRVAMQRLATLDPQEIASALEHGAYDALIVALQCDPRKVLAAILESGLQGRGGAGFPTGSKWKLVAEEDAEQKYVICNADESEPATFKDRVLIDGDPHLLLEGMALCGWAVGADTGIIYVRGEYARAARTLERAVAQAEERRLLGANINGTKFSFRIHVHRGAGAYICGEETALIESLEGRRGEPRIRPPYPTAQGLYGRPTVINNVETLCHATAIVARGAAWHRTLGTPGSPGVKLFSLTGHINNPGLVEAPLGITLRQLIQDFAGGIRSGSEFKMALTGGAAGTIVGPDALDIPLDFASHERGISLGSGGILVMDQSVSVVELLGWLLHFFEVESCGKCTPCREGTRLARELINRMTMAISASDSQQLAHYAKLLGATSLCGLGQSVAWPLESAMKNFPAEFGTER
jgi:NADH:ubiquinone oxidoreductase subunit F (NADH-binding)/NADH:ubiquinone oxidoreductase subunit E